MRQIAAEFKHSETAFVTREPDGSVSLRYFTPPERWSCAATRRWPPSRCCGSWAACPTATALPIRRAGELTVTVRGDTVWMDMAPPQLLADIPSDERAALYAAYGLTEGDCPAGYIPRIVSTGLADIMLPVRDHDTLMRAVQNAPAVTELS